VQERTFRDASGAIRYNRLPDDLKLRCEPVAQQQTSYEASCAHKCTDESTALGRTKTTTVGPEHWFG